MRGTIPGILMLGVLIALLPVMFEFDSPDSLGNDFISVIQGFAGPVVVALFLVACGALVVAFMSTDGY